MKGCAILPWDSTFFGKRIARLSIECVTAADMTAAVQWATVQAIDCLYYLAPFEDTESVRLAEEFSFHQVDLRLTFERGITATAFPPGVRPGALADRPALQEIARVSFLDTRFNRDPRFASRANALYETWVERALEGFADAVFVSVGADGAPIGFVCCHRRESQLGELGLTAVRVDQRGQGVGNSLVAAAHAWFHIQGLNSTFVVTNGANLAAQRLYQRNGFVSKQVQIWYHRWFTQPTDRPSR